MASVPTVVGRPVNAPVPVQGTIVTGCPYRIDPNNLSRGNIRSLKPTSSDSAVEKRIAAAQRGSDMMRKYPMMPETRAWRDTYMTLAFFATMVALIVVCLIFKKYQQLINNSGDNTGSFELSNLPTPVELIVSAALSCAVSLLVALLFVNFARSYPGCVVWTSLIAGPVMTMLFGVVLIALGLTVMGVLFIGLGMLSLVCTLYCWAHLIPFMIDLLEAIATVITQHSSMLAVSTIGSVGGLAWCMLTFVAFFGIYVEFEAEYQAASSHARYFAYFIFCFILVWGMLVANNVCHVTYVGVFGSWFHGKVEGRVVSRSLRIALTTSFGSICMGSFFIAIIRALEMMTRKARQDAQEGGNMVACILLCILECVISCLGDIMEYFSEWAYVQVAVRGCGFIDAVRITMGLCTCTNMVYILQDLLLDAVVSFGTLFAGASGALAGAVIGAVFGGTSKIAFCSLLGLVAGIVAGGSALQVISSGIKTVLMLWAENPEALELAQPRTAASFHDKMMQHWD